MALASVVVLVLVLGQPLGRSSRSLLDLTVGAIENAVAAEIDALETVVMRGDEDILVESMSTATSAVSALPSARNVRYICLTGVTFAKRGQKVWQTWGHTIASPDRFLFATSQKLPPVSVGGLPPAPVPQWQHEHDDGTYGAVNSRYYDAITKIRDDALSATAFYFVFDDDAFVNAPAVRRFIETIDHDPMEVVMWGQMECDILCGGGGALLSPGLVQKIQTMPGIFSSHSTALWDQRLSKAVQQPPFSGVLVQHPGFHGQPPPPYFTQEHNLDARVTARVDAARAEVISFHYIDLAHQNAGGLRGQYACEAPSPEQIDGASGRPPCHDLYFDLFKEYY